MKYECRVCFAALTPLPHIDAYRCMLCGNVVSALDLHRRTYKPPIDTLTLCSVCAAVWYFEPIPPGQFELAPCGHVFLMRSSTTGQYSLSEEPPE